MGRWLPLESNPAVLNKFLGDIGVPSSWAINDVLGMDEELLATVPQPVAAVILLYPINDTNEAFKTQQEESIDADGQEVSDKVYFMKQCVGNSCGTVALIHAVGNNTEQIGLSDGALKSFLEKTEAMSPEERGNSLEEDEGISSAHEDSAKEGQSATVDRDTQLDTHFIAFVHVDGKLYELDGRKKYVINHGDTSPDSLLKDSATVCKQFMERDPKELRYAVVALTANPE
ncbi:unnamed protein product [Meganyctiphanes norvegica]|uniref:Ubiquitin carboxyl-terminal hydrolase n=1 Tax=Meganyctiphanes norvegica TaxID=48144 RepID=A0AAV2QLN9_MEGNR